MILGIDHLALTVSNLAVANNDLIARGFSCVFIEQDIINHPMKKSLLSNFHATHDIGFYRSNKKGISIEIVNHHAIADNATNYEYCDDYIELKTNDIEKEKIFWKVVFRFQEAEQNFLRFKSPLPHWSCTIKISEAKHQSQSTLDAQGYTCLAFLSNNLEEDIQVAKTNGATDVLAPFRLTVNKQALDVSMFRTPGGAICELIKIVK